MALIVQRSGQGRAFVAAACVLDPSDGARHAAGGPQRLGALVHSVRAYKWKEPATFAIVIETGDGKEPMSNTKAEVRAASR